MQFFDPVFDLAARAVGLFVDELGRLALVGDDKAGIVFGLAAVVENDLGFDDHAARLFPGTGLIKTLAKDLGALVSQLGVAAACRSDKHIKGRNWFMEVSGDAVMMSKACDRSRRPFTHW
jgi:hypothetical protein